MGKQKYIFEELVGKKVNHLTLESISKNKTKRGQTMWDFKCDCGRITSQVPGKVYANVIKSCGCMHYENAKFPDYVHKKKKIDTASKIIGKRSGRLVVKDFKLSGKGDQTILLCECDCGGTKEVKIHTFKDGRTKSCGCLIGEKNRKDETLKGNHYHLFKKLEGMKCRCYNKNSNSYYRYGGRGIVICDEWLKDSWSFIKWAEEHGGLDESLTIDRIDNDGPYAPWNCRFTTQKQQQRNRSVTKIIEYNGELHCIPEWAEITGISSQTIRSRIRHGWEIKDVLTVPPDTRNRIVKNY